MRLSCELPALGFTRVQSKFLARAARYIKRKARTRSAIKLRSSSATAPSTVNAILPVAVVVHLVTETHELDAKRAEGFKRTDEVRH
jgi:hypothetical protein